MYLRLGELPLYLSRSVSDGGFKRVKDGYFKTQAVSPLVEEVRGATKSSINEAFFLAGIGGGKGVRGRGAGRSAC